MSIKINKLPIVPPQGAAPTLVGTLQHQFVHNFGAVFTGVGPSATATVELDGAWGHSFLLMSSLFPKILAKKSPPASKK